MRKVVASAFMSLDGVTENANEFITEWDDMIDAFGERLIATQDAVLLGRRTYDEWVTFWPTSDIEPFASFINPVAKYVVTATMPETRWTNTTVVNDGVTGFVSQLKQQDGGDIGIHGSISLTQSLLDNGLVDEIRLVVVPTLQGRGRRLFEHGTPKQLVLTSGEVSPTGSLLLSYRVTPVVPRSFLSDSQ